MKTQTTQTTNTQMLGWIHSFDMSQSYTGEEKKIRFKNLYYVDMVAETPQEFLQTLTHNEVLDIMDDIRRKQEVSRMMDIVLEHISNNRDRKLEELGI